MAKGLDVGTCFLVGASHTDDTGMGDVQVKSVRDSFLDLENEQGTRTMLKLNRVPFIEKDDTLFVIGDAALRMANILKKEIRRPLSKGVIAAGEREAEKILLVLLKEVVGQPSKPGEVVYFSVPAAPIDAQMDVVYHEAIFKKILTQLGYTAVAMNEAAAVVYANAAAEQFTALGLSCLTPGQRVLTDKGLVPIEEFRSNMKVLTKGSAWRKGTPTSREYKGLVYLISSYGGGSAELTGNHLVWSKRGDLDWGYTRADELKEGDLVQQPWDNFEVGRSSPYVCTMERVTCSTPTMAPRELTQDMAELIGMFLGDGSIGGHDRNEISIDIGNDDPDIISRAVALIDQVLGKKATTYPHGDGATRIKCYSKGLGNWLKENCYDPEGVKVLPWGVHELSDHTLRGLLAGLINTDGHFTETGVTFTNSSPHLAQLAYLAMQRLGLNPSISARPPRDGGVLSSGRQIIGKKDSFTVSAAGVEASCLKDWITCTSRRRSAKKAYTYGAQVSRITSITSRPYEGVVYDISVVEGDDHSFCLPGIAVHNCGAGMTNVALLYQTMVGMKFSCARGGDWIDEGAARATGRLQSQIMAIKEQGVDLLDTSTGDFKTEREREAIVVYYRNLIHYVVDSIKKEFRKSESSVQIDAPIPIIISGGTSKAGNFLEFFKQEFAKIKDFPFEVSEVRMAEDPLADVAKGLLIAASLDD